MALQEKVLGHVKWFDKKKGYGYITAENGQDYFFHYTNLLKEGFKTTYPGQKVQFDISNAQKGVQATNILECSS